MVFFLIIDLNQITLPYLSILYIYCYYSLIKGTKNYSNLLPHSQISLSIGFPEVGRLEPGVK